MQILFITSFAMTMASALFIGNAFSGGYTPYMGFIAAFLFLYALFMPFMSEYKVVSNSFTKIGSDFKSLMKSEEKHKGDVDIILPAGSSAPPETYNLNTKSNPALRIIIALTLAFVLLSADAAIYYLVEGGLPNRASPISNF